MNKSVNLPKLFVILSLFIGTLLVMLVPPFNAPDEETHFMYSYEISEGSFLPKVENEEAGHYIPSAVFASIEENKKLVNDREAKYSYNEMYYDNLLSSEYKNKGFMKLNVQTKPIIAYLAPAVGVEVATHLEAFSDGKKVSTEVLLQFARFFSLLAYTIIGYFAIKITPKFKKSFFAILLLPMSVFLRSVVSYDGFILVISALALANILKLIDTKNIKFTKRHFILFVITGFVLLNVKTVYSIIFLGLLAVPNEAFGTKKNKVKKYVQIGVLILAISFVRRLFYSGLPSSSNELFGEQINYIISHPFNYFKILVHNVLSQLKIQSWWLFGTYGCLDTYVPMLFEFLLKLYLVIVIIMDIFHEKIKISKWIKIGYFVCTILSVFAMYSYMYIYWTTLVTNEVGGNFITGVQGRYYIPLLLLFPIIFNNNLIDKIKNEKVRKLGEKIYNIYDNNFHYFTIFSLVFAVIIIVLRFYV